MSFWFDSQSCKQMLTSKECIKSQMVKETRFDVRLKHWIARILPSDGEIRSRNGSVWWWMTDWCINKIMWKRNEWMRGEVSYPWRRAGHGACMSLPGGAPGESGWSFFPAEAPGTPWSVEMARGRGDGGQTKTTGGMEGAVTRKRLEGVGDLKDGGAEKK